jgi:fibronectin type 3 domain-containing protein
VFFLNIIGCDILNEYLAYRKLHFGTLSDEKGVTTAKGKEVRAPKEKEVTVPIEKGAITIAWDSSDDPDLTGYKVYYGSSPKEYDNSVNIGKPPESSPGIMKYSLTNLVKGKKYYIAVVAVNKNNKQSGFSAEVSGVAK